jgi:hypothetical protein
MRPVCGITLQGKAFLLIHELPSLESEPSIALVSAASRHNETVTMEYVTIVMRPQAEGDLVGNKLGLAKLGMSVKVRPAKPKPGR